MQRRIATAVILNSIPLATNPNGALLLTWLLDTSGFHSRYSLLAPRFTPHLSHLCTHKLASLTVLRIINQKSEPEASTQIVNALFFSPSDHVLTDVLGDQVNGVSVIHKVITSSFIDPALRPSLIEATKRVLVDLKVTGTQAYRRLVEVAGLPTPSFPTTSYMSTGKKTNNMNNSPIGLQTQYGNGDTASLAAMMAALQMQGQHHLQSPASALPPQLLINPGYGQSGHSGPSQVSQPGVSPATFSPSSDPFNPFAIRSPETHTRNTQRRGNSNVAPQTNGPSPGGMSPLSLYAGVGSGAAVNGGNSSLAQAGNMMNSPFTPTSIHPQVYQQYMFELYRQQNTGTFHA